MNLLSLIFPTKHERDIKRIRPLLDKVNEFGSSVKNLSDSELREKTTQFRNDLNNGVSLYGILPEAFAVAREACDRVFGRTYHEPDFCLEVFGDDKPRFGRPFDVQVLGGIILFEGKIAEMKTGEGKTLVATMPVYLRALAGKGVHIVTTNEYLAKRDCKWMSKVYEFLGLTVGCIDLHPAHSPGRRTAYSCDITFGTNNEFGFDYLRDNMVDRIEHKVQRSHAYCIVDEVDSILIDEARTPLIISGPSESNTDKYYQIDKILPRLRRANTDEQGKEIPGTGDFIHDEKDRAITITEDGVHKIESMLGIDNLYALHNIDILHHVNMALRAHKVMRKDFDYIVENGEVVIIDEFTGRKMEGRRYSDGLHQAIEAKERVNVVSENQTLASITFQNYFRMYETVAGMTGTADTEAEEFRKIYKLDVVVVPTNVPNIRSDYPDKIYRTEHEKFTAIINDIKETYLKGQPVLIGTASVEKSEVLSTLLTKRGLKHEVLNAKNHTREAVIIENAGQRGSITIATNMAGRGTDIKLGKGVIEAGGLKIVGSERHESRRIDNQLRGRSGRQGDKGESIFYLSMEDDLMRRFGSEKMSALMQRLGMREGEEIQHRWISNAITNAQKKVEGRNFEIRKHLLEYDDVMNTQRKYIYRERDFILSAPALDTKIKEIIEDAVYEQLDSFAGGSERLDENVFESVTRWMEGAYGIRYTISPSDRTGIKYLDFENSIIQEIFSQYKARRAGVPEDVFLPVERAFILRIIDNRWKEHLLNMDHLREGIGLRSYGEKKPITEFKNEGFKMFEVMISNTRFEILENLFRLEVRLSHSPTASVWDNASAHHENISSLNSSPPGGEEATRPQLPRKPQMIRSAPQTGRNEPCPCGSGKKFKHCCGKI